MTTLGLIGNACGAIGMFGLAWKTEDKWGRAIGFVLAGLNVAVILAHFLTNA